MEHDLLLFMENVLIDENKDDILIVIDLKEMLDENEFVVVRINYGKEKIKEEKFEKRSEKWK